MAFKIKKPLPPKAEPETTEEGENAPLEGDILPPSPVANLPGVESVDRMVVASENAFDFLQKNRVAVLGAVGALLVGILGFGAIKAISAERAYDDSQRVYHAAAQNFAPIGAPADAGEFWAEGDAIYATLSARNEGRLQAANDAAANTKGGAQRLSHLLQATAAAETGKSDQAQSNYASFREGAQNNIERTVADFGAAVAQASAGNLAGALSALDAIATERPGQRAAADEQRASLVDAYGTREQALETWKAVAAAHSDADLGRRAASRVEQLEILTATVAP